MKNKLFELFRCVVIFIAMYPICAYADPVSFTGQLHSINEDSGSAIYSGVPIGTAFTGVIDDVTGSGQISDGSTITSFTCCSLAAENVDIENDQSLSAEEAALLNSLSGSVRFSPGDLIDSVNLEGDAETPSGGRIEVGLSYILNSSAFTDQQSDNYPFNSNDLLLTVFFILEEDPGGDDDIYDAIGVATTSGDTFAPTTDGDNPSSSQGLSPRDLDGDVNNAEAYYDSVLNITWLKDANVALTENFDVPEISDGRMDFPTAQLYINSMNSASYLGQTSWRLPTLRPVAGGNVYNNSFTNNATSDVGNGIAGIGWADATGAPVSEMGHLYYATLGNIGRYVPNGDGIATSFVEHTDWGVSNTGPFLNLNTNPDEFGTYWYGLVDVSTVFNAPPSWYFAFAFGGQQSVTAGARLFVWPVHDGDIGTPVSDEDNDIDPVQDPEQPATGNGGSSGGGVFNYWMLMIFLGIYVHRSLIGSHFKRSDNVKRLGL